MSLYLQQVAETGLPIPEIGPAINLIAGLLALVTFGYLVYNLWKNKDFKKLWLGWPTLFALLIIGIVQLVPIDISQVFSFLTVIPIVGAMLSGLAVFLLGALITLLVKGIIMPYLILAVPVIALIIWEGMKSKGTSPIQLPGM